MPRGGPRPGSGRPPGSRNKMTAEADAIIKQFALDHLEEHLDKLHTAIENATRPADIASLLNLLWTRAFGRAPETLTITGASESDTPATVGDLLAARPEHKG